jgi:hypothetical protein
MHGERTEIRKRIAQSAVADLKNSAGLRAFANFEIMNNVEFKLMRCIVNILLRKQCRWWWLGIKHQKAYWCPDY